MKKILFSKSGPTSLEPFAARVEFLFNLPMTGKELEKLLLEYIKEVGSRCDENDGAIIGHIKALALFSEKKFFSMSMVSASHPLGKDGGVPDDLKEVQITLNVLVYGLPEALIKSVVNDATEFMGDKWSCDIMAKPLEVG